MTISLQVDVFKLNIILIMNILKNLIVFILVEPELFLLQLI
jgi:hypothetical protein